MEPCTYFRCKTTQSFDRHLAKLVEYAEGYQRYPIEPITVGGVVIQGVCFHRVTRPTEPEWLNLATTLTSQTFAEGKVSIRHSAIFLLQMAEITYAMTFGQGHTIARRLNVERRFGKTVVSNGKNPDQVRALKAGVTGPYSKVRSEHRATGGPLGVLEIPRGSGTLGSLAAQIQLITKHVAEGGIGIRTDSPTSVSELVAIIAQLESWWDGGALADALIASYDRMSEVIDQDTIDALNELMVDEIKSGCFNSFNVSVRSEELWTATEYACKYRNGKAKSIGLNITELLAALQGWILTGADPFKVQLRYRSEFTGWEQDGLIENLSFEMPTPQGGKAYSYENGGWYEASAQWDAKLKADMQTIARELPSIRSQIAWPAFGRDPKRHEENYLSSLCGALGTRTHNCHGTLCPTTNLEVCDVLIDGSYLVFAKRGCGNAACSSAVGQVKQALEALIDEPAFAEWAEKTFFTPNGWTLDLHTGRQQLTAVLLLLDSKAGRNFPHDLTIRSKHALSMFLQDTVRLGFRAAAIAV